MAGTHNHSALLNKIIMFESLSVAVSQNEPNCDLGLH